MSDAKVELYIFFYSDGYFALQWFFREEAVIPREEAAIQPRQVEIPPPHAPVDPTVPGDPRIA